MVAPLVAPLIGAGIAGLMGGMGNAMGGGNTTAMSGVHPSKNAPIWQDVGLNTLAYYMSALGNPMFANDPNYESMYGDRLRSTGVTPNMGAQASRGFGYMDSPQQSPMSFMPNVQQPPPQQPQQNPMFGGGGPMMGGGMGRQLPPGVSERVAGLRR